MEELLNELDDAISYFTDYLIKTNKKDDGYKNAIEALKVLNETRYSLVRDSESKSWLRPELLIPVFGTVVEILLVMNHERLNVITTKMWPRIGR